MRTASALLAITVVVLVWYFTNYGLTVDVKPSAMTTDLLIEQALNEQGYEYERMVEAQRRRIQELQREQDEQTLDLKINGDCALVLPPCYTSFDRNIVKMRQGRYDRP